jgi:hypothetical protein
MTQDTTTVRVAPDEYVEFLVAGAAVKGEFHCAECGYGVTIVRVLPVCPMCRGTSWEQSEWSPFRKATSLL